MLARPGEGSFEEDCWRTVLPGVGSCGGRCWGAALPDERKLLWSLDSEVLIFLLVLGLQAQPLPISILRLL